MPKLKKNIDPTDLEIIRILQEDGRKSYAQIASQLNISPSAVQQRANRLVKDGIIVIKGLIHPGDLIDAVTAMVAVKADGTKVQAVAKEISKLAEVRWVVICAGQYDILLEIVCESNEKLLDLLSNKISAVDGVRDLITFPYLEITKRTYEWILPPNFLING